VVHWLRLRLVTGFVVAVPLIISVAAFIWLFQLIDGVMVPVYARWLGREIPGIGLVTLLVAVLLVGVVATNVFGGRLLQRGEEYLLRLPVFRAVYGPVKQLIGAFSPDSKLGFKKVVLLDDPRRGLVLGFLTKQFVLDRGNPCLSERRRDLSGSEYSGGGPDLSDRGYVAVTPRSRVNLDRLDSLSP